MSAPALVSRPTTTRVGPAARPASRSQAGVRAQPRIRVVERPATAPRHVGFVVSCTALLGALMVGLLLLNVVIGGNAFTLAELNSEKSLLADRQQALEQALMRADAPSSLAARASALGMVPAPQTIVLSSDGTGAPPLAPAP